MKSRRCPYKRDHSKITRRKVIGKNFLAHCGWWGKQLKSWWKIDLGWERIGAIRKLVLHQRSRHMSSQPCLSAEQEAEAQRIFQVLRQTSEQDLLALSRLLASKPDRQLLGKTEFEVRDRVHQIGAK